MMEAMRILQAVGARPRRTIRLALWGGEEQGLLGSREYVRRHFGDTTTMTLTPAHENLSGYFNLDNGAGKLRGIWLQENYAVAPVFDAWLASLGDLGVTTLGPRRVSGTDHVSFDAIGATRVPVHAGSVGVQLADPSLEHGRRRQGATGRRDPDGRGGGNIRV